MKFSKKKTLIHIHNHIQNHTLNHIHILTQKTKKTKHNQKTKKNINIINPNPQLLNHIPNHTQNHNHTIKKNKKNLILTHPIIFLHTTKINNHLTNTIKHLPQKNNHHLKKKNHHHIKNT